jgi:hypothetical protein
MHRVTHHADVNNALDEEQEGGVILSQTSANMVVPSDKTALP